MSTTTSTPFTLGVFVGNANNDDPSAEATFDSDVQAFDGLMGTKPVVMNSYIDFTAAPSAWLNNNGWSAASAAASPSWKGVIPTIALPMASTNAGAPSAQQILENYIDGSYDSMLQGMVQTWASDGFMTQYWRPGVEMNLDSTYGSASMQALWISAFQHIYTTLHAAAAADGVNLKVIWNPGTDNDGPGNQNATQTMYPGNQYVDVIGVDTYGDIYPYGNYSQMYDWDKSGQMLNSPNPVYDTNLQTWASDPVNLEHYYTYPASTQWSLDGSGGTAMSLQQLIDFAKAQGKPIAICETGAGNTGGSTSVTDNPTFVQWLSSTLTSAGVPVEFVSIWDDNGGGTYEFSQASDGKPLEDAAWAKYFGAQATTVAPITITTATAAIPTPDTTSVQPFTNVAITDTNSGQTETVIVTLSSAANGTLLDPNAATDGSTAATGVWSISGSATTVASALDGLVFVPTVNQVAPGASVTTTVTAAVTDTAGQTSSATSTITAKVPDHASSVPDTQATGTTGTVYDTSGNAWTIDGSQQIEENGAVVPSSAEVVTLFWTGTALDQLNTSGDWWTQPLNGSSGTELSGAPTGYVDPPAPITIAPGTEAVATTDGASVKPFSGEVITDANSGQTETAQITLSAAGNGTLSDPNAATDGSTITKGVWTVSGSSTAVATALDGLVFTPTAHEVAPKGVVTTTLTGTITDTDGQTASTTSTVTATAVAAPIAITPATEAVKTTDAASVKAFSGVAITDANAGQTETASVTLGAAANGTLSDPNAATDGSKITSGVLTVSGSSTAVAKALDGLLFTPTAHEVAPKGVVTTTLTGTITDTAGQTASTTSTVTATAVAVPITITPATGAIKTSDIATAKPFTGVAITDANAGQIETASVTLSTAANGTLSDPNAATDGSKITSGVLTVSGSAAAVATALDGLVFKPTANQVAAGATVTTTVTAAIKDTAGETASAASTITATQVAAPPPPLDTLALHVSEDAWNGDAAFTVAVDGKQVGGDFTASALHSSGDAGTVLLTGDWGSGVNNVAVSFINDAYGGSASEDRNLYVNSISENGVTYAGTSGTLDANGSEAFAVGGATPTATSPADTLTLNLSQDAWQGNAEFVLYIDGKAVTTPQSVTALHDQNATQSFSFAGSFGAGAHTIGVGFVNDAYGGSASEDRNLYINGVTLNGSNVFSGVRAQDGNGTSFFTATTTS